MRKTNFNITAFLLNLVLLGYSLPLSASSQGFSCVKYFAQCGTSVSVDEGSRSSGSWDLADRLDISSSSDSIVCLSCFLVLYQYAHSFVLKRYLLTNSGNDPPLSRFF